MIEFKHPQLSIKRQCELLDLNRSNLYYNALATILEDLELLKLIEKLYFSVPFYGYRKVTIWLKNQGFNVTQNESDD